MVTVVVVVGLVVVAVVATEVHDHVRIINSPLRFPRGYYCCNCVEQKPGETEGVTQREQMLQQQLDQANKTIAALTEHLSRIQLETSQCFNVLLIAALSYLPMIY